MMKNAADNIINLSSLIQNTNSFMRTAAPMDGEGKVKLSLRNTMMTYGGVNE
jgi:hypothetical protein